MAQQTLNDGVSFGEQRSKINSNFTELYSTKTNNSNAAIVGGTIDATSIGQTTPAAGAFTTLSATGNLSVAVSGEFAGTLHTNNSRCVLMDNSIEEHSTNGTASIAVNFIGYGGGIHSRHFDIYNGRSGLLSRFDGENHGLLVGSGIESATSAGRRLRVIGQHDSAVMQLYSQGGGAGLDPSLDFWASEPNQTYRGCGLGSNVNKHPYYGPRDTGNHGSYIRFREDGYISVGKSLPGETVFTDRLLINPYGLLMAYEGLSMNSGTIYFNESNVRAWQLQAIGGNVRLSSGDDLGALEVPTLLVGGGNLLVGTSAQLGIGRVCIQALVGTHGVVVKSGDDGNFLYSGLNSAGTGTFHVYGNGNVVNANNSYGAISDLKLKEDITDCTPKLNKLNQVRIVNYRLKSDPDHKQLGVIAQELEQIFPGLVEETEDYKEVTKTREVEVPAVTEEHLVTEAVFNDEGEEIEPAVYETVEITPATTKTEEYTERVATGEVTKSVKYSVFVPMLIKAVQEQSAIISSLEGRLAKLEELLLKENQ